MAVVEEENKEPDTGPGNRRAGNPTFVKRSLTRSRLLSFQLASQTSGMLSQIHLTSLALFLLNSLFSADVAQHHHLRP